MQETLKVSEIPENYQLAQYSQDIAPLKEQFPESKDYSCFWVSKEDLEHGEITHCYAIERSIPYNEDIAHLFLSQKLKTNTQWELDNNHYGKGISAKEIIQREYGKVSKNFITPRILKYGKITHNIAYEISSGDWLDRPIYGLSIAQLMIDGKTVRRSDLSRSFDSMEKLETYIEELTLKEKPKSAFHYHVLAGFHGCMPESNYPYHTIKEARAELQSEVKELRESRNRLRGSLKDQYFEVIKKTTALCDYLEISECLEPEKDCFDSEDLGEDPDKGEDLEDNGIPHGAI